MNHDEHAAPSRDEDARPESAHSDLPRPSEAQLEASEHTEKRTVDGEVRYYVKGLETHLKAWGHPNPDGLVSYFTPDGRFHAQGVEREHQMMLTGMMMGAVS